MHSQLYATGVLSVSAPPFSANFDLDGDGDDLVQWQGDFGMNAMSDADIDGDSDGADFLAWQQQLGLGPSRASGSNDASAQSSGSGMLAAPAIGAVPEPSVMVLVAIGLAARAVLRGRRQA